MFVKKLLKWHKQKVRGKWEIFEGGNALFFKKEPQKLMIYYYPASNAYDKKR